jgi:hypothetical protein
VQLLRDAVRPNFSPIRGILCPDSEACTIIVVIVVVGAEA